MFFLNAYILLFIAVFTISLPLNAKPAALVKQTIIREENPRQQQETLILPYAFSTEGMGLVFGIGLINKGFLQPQMTSGASIFGGEESTGLIVGLWDYKLAAADRLFFSFAGMLGEYPRNKAFSSGSQFIPDGTVRPGSNDSNNEQFILAEGDSSWSEFKLEYSLPFAATAFNPALEQHLKGGILTSQPLGGKSWNPLESGAMVAVLRQFNRYQSYESAEQSVNYNLHGLELGLLYDNTDFPSNPSYGSSQYFAVTHAPQFLSNDNPWSFVEFEASKYLSFGATSWAKQRILAFNTWLAYSPSWQLETNEQGDTRAIDKPPFMEGATLGGFYRMRGFEQNRFHDKAAIYTTAEYRYTLDYNPVQNIDWLRFLKMDWVQLVPFVEAGRVSPTFHRQELLHDWKYDAGIAVRAFMAGTVIRLDFSNSSEGFSAWVMVGQPF